MNELRRIVATDLTLDTIIDALSVCVNEVDGITGQRDEQMRHVLGVVQEWRAPENLGVEVTVAESAGADGAIVVNIDTEFEPDGSDGGPALRVLINDDPAYVGKDYEPVEEQGEEE